MIVVHILFRDSLQVALVADEDMVQALATEVAEKSLTDNVGVGGGNRCANFIDACACCNGREMLSILGVIVANQVLGPITLPIFWALTSGTTLYLWLASNQWIVWVVSSIIFLVGLGVAAYWFYRADQAAQCELPAPKQTRKYKRGSAPTSSKPP